MDDFFINVGEDAAITVFINGEVILGVLHTRVDEKTVQTEVYTEDDLTLKQGLEALAASVAAVEIHANKPDIDSLIKAAIERMRRESREEEGQPPSPADDLGDFPF